MILCWLTNNFFISDKFVLNPAKVKATTHTLRSSLLSKKFTKSLAVPSTFSNSPTAACWFSSRLSKLVPHYTNTISTNDLCFERSTIRCKFFLRFSSAILDFLQYPKYLESIIFHIFHIFMMYRNNVHDIFSDYIVVTAVQNTQISTSFRTISWPIKSTFLLFNHCVKPCTCISSKFLCTSKLLLIHLYLVHISDYNDNHLTSVRSQAGMYS